jgi:hypothetical protein
MVFGVPARQQFAFAAPDRLFEHVGPCRIEQSVVSDMVDLGRDERLRGQIGQALADPHR